MKPTLRCRAWRLFASGAEKWGVMPAKDVNKAIGDKDSSSGGNARSGNRRWPLQAISDQPLVSPDVCVAPFKP